MLRALAAALPAQRSDDPLLALYLANLDSVLSPLLAALLAPPPASPDRP